MRRERDEPEHAGDNTSGRAHDHRAHEHVSTTEAAGHTLADLVDDPCRVLGDDAPAR